MDYSAAGFTGFITVKPFVILTFKWSINAVILMEENLSSNVYVQYYRKE